MTMLDQAAASRILRRLEPPTMFEMSPRIMREAVAECETRLDGMPASADERYLRRLLAARVAMPHTYMDDGEAQGQEHGIVIDFMRDPVADIDAKLRALNVARYECSKAPNVRAKRGQTAQGEA